MRIKPLSDVSNNYKESIKRVPGAYKKEVERTTNFKEKAIKGEELFKAKMEEVIANESRKKGLEKMKEGKWKRGAADVGSTRIAGGMRAKISEQKEGFAPFHSELAALELPARTTDPMENVVNRVGAIAKRLSDKKKELRG